MTQSGHDDCTAKFPPMTQSGHLFPQIWKIQYLCASRQRAVSYCYQ